MGWGLRFAAGALAVLTAGSGIVFWGALRITAPGPLDHNATVVIPRGSGIETIAITLDDAGVIDTPLLFVAAAKFSGPLKAGEYAIPAGISIDGVIDLLRSGRTVVHRITIPEGLTSAQVVALLDKETALTGALKAAPKNGTLLPETYHFSYGDSREGLVERMKRAMDQTIAEAWKSRAPDLPVTTPSQALTLASIVEKETGVASERPMVAGVFVNRLESGMRLQSDPTVIFALTDGKGELGRSLTHNDLKIDSPYNTYQVTGLPPGPIANPGRASIEAALHPEHTDNLYFVADGSGGHVFAKSLADHNRNVAKWREVQRRQSGGESAAD